MSNGRIRFLIVGTARSGTTLVQRLCCELPEVWVPPETHFWPLAAEATQRFEYPLRAGNRQDMVTWLLDRLRDRTLPVSRPAILDEIHKRSQRVGLWVVFESLVAAMSPPVSVLGEKTPGHVAHWEQLTTANADLKLIGVIRDPHAVLRSHRNMAWGEHDAWALGERWLAHQRSLEDAGRLLGRGRVLVIRYEDLVEEPAAHQHRIADFLGVAPDATPLETGLITKYPLFPARETWKGNALGAVTTDKTGGWDADLTAEDVAIVDHVTGSTMTRFGYGAATDGAPPPMGARSRSAVAAFRHWYALMTADFGLPIT